MSKNKLINITFLGTAANGGIPQVDCRCINCRSKSLTRKRSSILIKVDKKNIIIDCGPDFHSQLIENNLRLQDISGILISHLHWDHSAGLFELSSGKTLNIPVVTHKNVVQQLLSSGTFNFVFDHGWAKLSEANCPKIEFIQIDHDPQFTTCAIRISHKNKSILVATDVWKINKRFIDHAINSNLIIFDGTFLNESKHWHVAIKESATILAKLTNKVIYTHINHSEDSIKVQAYLKNFGFKLAFDGMTVKL